MSRYKSQIRQQNQKSRPALVSALAVQLGRARELVELGVVDGGKLRTATQSRDGLVCGRVQHLERLGDAAEQGLQEVGGLACRGLHRETPEVVPLPQRLGVEDASGELGHAHAGETVGRACVAADGQEAVVNGVEDQAVGHCGHEAVVVGGAAVPCVSH